MPAVLEPESGAVRKLTPVSKPAGVDTVSLARR